MRNPSKTLIVAMGFGCQECHYDEDQHDKVFTKICLMTDTLNCSRLRSR